MDLTALRPDPLELPLQRELRAGERLLWRGRRLPRFVWEGLAIWVFAIPWTAFAAVTALAFAGSVMFEQEAGVLGYAFPLFGMPFIAIGVVMLAAPFLPLFGAHRTLFTVTDQRLLRIYRGRRLKTRSVDGGAIGEIERSERGDGKGTLKIVVGGHIDREGDRLVHHFELGGVADVLGAESRVRELAERVRRATLSS